MTIVDSFSKWIEIYAIPNHSSEITLSCIWDYIRFGPPTQVISDKGTEFGGEFR